MTTKISSAHKEEAYYIYEAPLRIWHWINALALLALGVTGYLIASPLPSVPGEAYENFLMGYIRWIHFSSAYIVIVGFVFRIYWAFVGNSHSRQIFLPAIFKASWWGEVWYETKWYLMVVKEPNKYKGHNPLAALVMHFGFVWIMFFMIITGLALYGEGTGMGSWQHTLFSSWVIPLFGQSQDVHTWHHLGLWVLACFIIIHIYAAVREDIMSRQSIISAMVSGWRTFKDSKPADDSSSTS